jgi:iron complex transport system substrate-binding protein
MTARAFVLMLSGLLLAGGVAQALPVTDDRGVQLALAQPPQRIVSLLPSLTETVCALGQCQRLVGVDRYSNYPDFVRNLPQVGGGLDPNIEAIAALKPDLVLMATSTPVADRLQSLGIKVLALEPKSHADVQRALQIVGRVLEVSDAERVWREIDTAVLATAQAVPLKARALRIYFEVNSAPYAASTWCERTRT